MINNETSVCMILKSDDEIAFFRHMLNKFAFKKITAFNDAKEALKVILKQQFELFITRMEMPDMSGIVLIQKMRETGNYGMEVHLFIADKIDGNLVNTISELDMPYVLVKPFNFDRFSQKMKHLIQVENGLSEFESLYRSAKSALTGNIIEMAESIAEQLIEMDNNSEKVAVLLGDIALAKGDFQGAKNFFQKVIIANPKNSGANHKLAKTFMKEGDYEKAAGILNQLATTNSHNIALLENAGLSNFKIGNMAKAEEHMGKVREMDETNKKSGEVLSDIYISRGDFGQMQKVLSTSHDDKAIVAYLNNAGVELARKQDYAGAIKMYESCIDSIKSNRYIHAVYYNMGVAYKKLKNMDKAKESLVKAIEAEPGYQKAIDALKTLQSKR